jgi:hypothetical protein
MVGEVIEHNFLSKEVTEEKCNGRQVVTYDEGTQEYNVEYNVEEESC